MKVTTKMWTAAAVLTTGMGIWTATADRATRVAEAIWADDRLFGTVLTDTDFNSPPAQSTDVIFNFSASGLTGQKSVAEAAPGPGFNGGRWHVYAVTFTEAGKLVYDPDGNGAVNSQFTNAEDVLEAATLGHLVIQDAMKFFVCTLFPVRQ
jgi:hypothetical protein